MINAFEVEPSPLGFISICDGESGACSDCSITDKRTTGGGSTRLGNSAGHGDMWWL
jgi:hypothetical protein